MPVEEYPKLDIAHRLLATGLTLYLSGGDRLAVLHLAGAAEEILGRELQHQERTNALRVSQALTSAVSAALGHDAVPPKVVADIANRARNQVKHFDPSVGRTVRMDVEMEASDMLDRAISNYFRVQHDQTPEMNEFLRRRYG